MFRAEEQRVSVSLLIVVLLLSPNLTLCSQGALGHRNPRGVSRHSAQTRSTPKQRPCHASGSEKAQPSRARIGLRARDSRLASNKVVDRDDNRVRLYRHSSFQTRSRDAQTLDDVRRRRRAFEALLRASRRRLKRALAPERWDKFPWRGGGFPTSAKYIGIFSESGWLTLWARAVSCLESAITYGNLPNWEIFRMAAADDTALRPDP